MNAVLTNVLYPDTDFSFRRGDLHIENGLIVAAGKGPSVGSAGKIDCTGSIVLPGLVNAHTHNPAGPARGLFGDCPLEEWCGDTVQGRLQQRVFDYLDGAAEADFRILLLKAYGEYLKQGITFIVDSGQADDAELRQRSALKEIGLCGCVEAFDAIDAVHGISDEEVIFAAHLPEEEDIGAGSIAAAEGLRDVPGLHRMTHCLETEHRLGIIRELAGCSTVAYFDRKGLLDRRTLLFHLVHADADDLELLARRGVTGVYCPVSNAWSGAGTARVEAWLDRGINVALGTDFLLSDIWEVMRNAYYRLKSVPSPGRFSTSDVFRMATTGGAAPFESAAVRGRIEAGARADLVFIDAANPALWPLLETDGFSTLLYNILMNGGAGIVRHVLNGGEWVVRDSKLQKVDGGMIDREYGRIIRELYGDALAGV